MCKHFKDSDHDEMLPTNARESDARGALGEGEREDWLPFVPLKEAHEVKLRWLLLA